MTEPIRASRRKTGRGFDRKEWHMVRRALAVGVFALMALSVWVPVASAGGGCHGGQFVDARGVRVDLEGACFTPTVIRIQPGQSVTWTNKDPMEPTVTGAACQ